MRTVFIINPNSGTPKFVSRVHWQISRRFGTDNRLVTVVKSRHIDHVGQVAGRAAADGVDMVVAVGGDGTVNATAKALVNTDTALGVIPTGSGNGFARNVDMPLRVEKALKTLYEPKFRRIDVGSVGDLIFLVSCGMGWEAVIASMFEDKKFRGVITYTSIIMTTFLQYQPQAIEIVSQPGNWKYSGRPLMFSIANMREFGVGVTITPDARYDDGMLDICLIPHHGLLNSVKYAPEMFREQTDKIPGFIGQHAESITITREFPGNIHVDGTPHPAGREINVKVLPSALKIAYGSYTKPRVAFQNAVQNLKASLNRDFT